MFFSNVWSVLYTAEKHTWLFWSFLSRRIGIFCSNNYFSNGMKVTLIALSLGIDFFKENKHFYKIISDVHVTNTSWLQICGYWNWHNTCFFQFV